MFVENYRRKDGEWLMAGGDATPIPYPKLSAEDGVCGRHSFPFDHRMSIR